VEVWSAPAGRVVERVWRRRQGWTNARDIVAYSEEHERSFCVASEDLLRVLSTLWPSTGLISIATGNYLLQDQGIKLAIHLYSGRTGPDFRERLKLSTCKGRVRATVHQKIIVPDRKFEQCVATARRDEDVLGAVNDFGPVIAAFLKERAQLKYVSGDDWFKAGIDRTVPFDPGSPASHGDVVYQLEFEASDANVLRSVVNSEWFASTIGCHVNPMDIPDTKWVLASEHCPEPMRFSFRTAADLFTYWQQVIRELAPPEIPLDGFAEGAPWPQIE
jgi:hypothetical protein